MLNALGYISSEELEQQLEALKRGAEPEGEARGDSR
jgi:hypothetical protein